MPSPADHEVDEFAAACNRLYSIMRRNRSSLTAATRSAHELSESQLALVTPLADHGAMPVGRLAELARVAQPTATRALKALEREGFVAREPVGENRIVLVSLTPDGVRAWQAAVDRIRHLQRAALEQIPPDRRSTVVTVLTELAAVIDRTS